MPRFHLHLHECGLVLPDEEGLELPDLAAACVEATIAAREVMADEVRHGRLCLSCHIEVHDDAGVCLKRLPFKDMIALTGL